MEYIKLLLGFLLLFSSNACSGNDVFCPLPVEEMIDELDSAKDRGLSIQAIRQKDKNVYISFSDGRTVSCRCLIIGSIGLDGYWYVNGKKTSVVWSYPNHHICQSLNGQIAEDNREGECLGVLEGYTTWSFFFEDDIIITISKALFSYDPDTIIRGVGHRGFSQEAPENTLPSFRLAKIRGFNYVETDIRFTSDGIPVLLHDRSISRTSNGEGNVDAIELEQLKHYDFGSWKKQDFTGTTIPTFEEFLDLCCTIGLSPYIELKVGSKTQIEQLVDLVEEYNMIKRATIVSFDVSLLRYVHNYNSNIRLGLVTNTVSQNTISQAISLLSDSNDIYIGSSDWSPGTIELCKRSGLSLEVWTIDNKNTILSLPDYISGVVSNSLHAGRVLHDSK